MSRLPKAAAVSAWVAHVLAWATGAWLAFGPVYQGVSATFPGESADEATRSTATLIEVNGLYMVPLLLVPILLSGIAVWAVRDTDRQGLIGRLRRSLGKWAGTTSASSGRGRGRRQQ